MDYAGERSKAFMFSCISAYVRYFLIDLIYSSASLHVGTRQHVHVERGATNDTQVVGGICAYICRATIVGRHQQIRVDEIQNGDILYVRICCVLVMQIWWMLHDTHRVGQKSEPIFNRLSLVNR